MEYALLSFVVAHSADTTVIEFNLFNLGFGLVVDFVLVAALTDADVLHGRVVS